MKAKLKGYFEAVRAVYEEHGAESEYDFRLSKPATEAALAKLSKRIGGELHPSARALWSFANGSRGSPMLLDGQFLRSYALLSIAEALEQRGYFEARAPQYASGIASDAPRDPRVGEGWLSPGWLPFAEEEGGGVLLFDHTPLGTGKPGQIIAYSHDPDEIYFVADSLADLLPISRASIEEDPLEFLCVF